MVGGEGWVECAELARGGARDRGKNRGTLGVMQLGRFLNLLLAEEESIKSSEEEMWQRGIDKKGNTNGMEPRWPVHGGIMT